MENKPGISLVQSASAWAIWAAAFGYFFAFTAFVRFLPIYIKNVLRMEIDAIGSLVTLPFILMVNARFFNAQNLAVGPLPGLPIEPMYELLLADRQSARLQHAGFCRDSDGLRCIGRAIS